MVIRATPQKTLKNKTFYYKEYVGNFRVILIFSIIVIKYQQFFYKIKWNTYNTYETYTKEHDVTKKSNNV